MQITTNYNELRQIDNMGSKMAEYTPVIYSSNSLPCAPKKEEFLHFIFVLTYAEVHGGLDQNHRWTEILG